MRNLAAALLHTKNEGAPTAIDLDLLTTFLGHGPRSVVEWAEGGNLPADWNLLILVDQFEELFRYSDYAQREQAEAFVALLIESAEATGVSLHVVITMRSEYLGACALIPDLAERINNGLCLTPRMTREQCREAIEGPASVIGFTVEPALVTQLLNDLASFAPWEANETAGQVERLSRRSDQLPLMQHVLNRLWDRATVESGSTNVELRLSDYERIGGLAGALDAHGNEILDALGVERRTHVEQVFRALTTGTSVADSVRRPCRLGELVAVSGGVRDDVVAIVEAFSTPDCNFLRISEPSLASDGVIVDISHESLIRQWTPLHQWLEKEVRDGTTWRRLVSAQQRRAHGEGGLLAGLDLHTLLAWWDATKPTPAWASRHGGEFDETHAFLKESERAEFVQADQQRRHQIRERNRRRAGVSALLIVLVTAIGLGIFTLREERRSAANMAEVLGRVTSTINSDQYGHTLGLSQMQSDLLSSLEPYQSAIRTRYSNIVDPAIWVRYENQLGSTYGSIGDGRKAMEKLRQGYYDGLAALAALPRGKRPPEPLAASLIEAGVDYSWNLFDADARDEQAETIMRTLEDLAGKYEVGGASAAFRLAYSSLENLESRYFVDRHDAVEDRRHILKAIDLLTPVVARPDATMEAMNDQFIQYGNVSGDDYDSYERKACELGERMFAKNPIDTRAIRARVSCFRYQAGDARKRGDFDTAEKTLSKAEEVLRGVLGLVPDSQQFLLSLTEVETDISDLWWQPGQESQRAKHNLDASRYFISAVKGRTPLQSRTGQIRRLYDRLKETHYLSDTEQLNFFMAIGQAMELSVANFPGSRDYAFVAADAAANAGALLKSDAKRTEETEIWLSKAVDAFNRTGALDDISRFSEDFSAYCDAYYQRAQFFALRGRADRMMADIKTMTDSCSPALEKYPWDFYLRSKFTRGAEFAGKLLVEQKRYREAVPFLQYGSHWGVGAASTLLAQMYRDGTGVSTDQNQARSLEALARKQTVKRFTITGDFAGIKAPFYFYAIEWPVDYPFQGIDDQITWLKEARGGTIPPEVGELFRGVHKLARQKDVSFPELAVQSRGMVDRTGNKKLDKPSKGH